MKIHKISALLTMIMLAVACNNEPSLQEYYVENQENKEFVAIDMPTSLLTNNESLNEEQRSTLETVKKINLLAYPIKEGKEAYETEKASLSNILEDEKYQLLMKYGSHNRKAEIYFTGKEDAIDELIVFGFDDERGMGVARVLGEDMNPDNLLNFFKSLEKGDINLSGLQSLTRIFKGERDEEVE